MLYLKKKLSKRIFVCLFIFCSLDALDRVGSESPRNNNRRHYVNVAPPRPPKHGNNAIKIEARRSNPVYVNVYSLGRRKPGDIVQTGRYCDCIVMSCIQ